MIKIKYLTKNEKLIESFNTKEDAIHRTKELKKDLISYVVYNDDKIDDDLQLEITEATIDYSFEMPEPIREKTYKIKF